MSTAAERLGKRHAQEAEPEDPRWGALTRGDLSSEEAAVLRAEDPGRYENFRPIDEIEHQQIFDGVNRQLRRLEARRRLRGALAIAFLLVGAVVAWLVLGFGALRQR